MDFGMATFDHTPLLNHGEKTNTIRNHGSGFSKQERSVADPPDDQEPFLRTSKSSRTDYFDQPNKTMSMRSDSLLSVSAADANNMLSFSSSSTNTTKDGNQTSLFSFYQPSPAYIRNTGYGLQAAGGMHMPVSRYKGPFTPSQWMELEHQALIYKHFVANVPVPSHLLNPLRKSLNTFLFPGSSSSTSSYAPNSYGWGTFHLGFSGNTDPEPGRCRRTDGKKWRCSRDAVPDQKYCERHINRGRHRSRKPVEGQNGHVVSAPKVGAVVSSSPAPVASVHNQFKTNAESPINRAQESEAFDISSFSVPKQQDSLMYNNNNNNLSDQGALAHFGDEWSKIQPGRTAWPEEAKPDWTQLSMSIPMDSSTQQKQWIPISWGQSMGGPLGEVLNRTNRSKNASETWDHTNNYQLGSSPTGVLQKTTFVSLSNSSSGSSPKGNKKEEHGTGLCDELLLSTLAS